MNRNEYLAKKNNIDRNLNVAKNFKCKILIDANTIRYQAGDIIMKVQDEIDSIDNMALIVRNLPDEYNHDNDETPFLLSTGVEISTLFANHAEYQYGIVNKTATEFSALQGSTAVSSATPVALDNIVFSLGRLISETYAPLQDIVSNYEVSVSQKRDKVISWLSSIDDRLAKKFSSVYNSLIDGEWMNAAHAMRETLSDLEHTLAPDGEVINAEWFIKDKNTESPTQRQRIKYAILGKSLKNVNDQDISHIENIEKIGRDIYNELSSESHRRSGSWDKGLVISYISTAQSVIEQIMELRKQFQNV